jgi:hypothetical protein
LRLPPDLSICKFGYPVIEIDTQGEKKMNTQKITSVNGELQALSLQNTLEKAGIPVLLVPSPEVAYLDVQVPAEYLYDARNLLFPEYRSGEIFCLPHCN